MVTIDTATFTFMHLADAFIQTTYSAFRLYIGFVFYQYMCTLGIEPTTFCAANTMFYHWATGTPAQHQRRAVFEELYTAAGQMLDAGDGQSHRD